MTKKKTCHGERQSPMNALEERLESVIATLLKSGAINEGHVPLARQIFASGALAMGMLPKGSYEDDKATLLWLCSVLGISEAARKYLKQYEASRAGRNSAN